MSGIKLTQASILDYLTNEPAISLADKPLGVEGAPVGSKRSRADLAEATATKLLAFSKQTRASFTKEFSEVLIPAKLGGLKPHYSIPSEVILLFLAFWIPIVIVCDSVLRFGSGEKVKYFPIFTLLGAIAMVTGSSSVVSTDSPAASESFPSPHQAESAPAEATEEITLTTEGLRELFRFVGHEEHIGRGALEFMIYKDLMSDRIESLVEVKDKLPSPTDMLRASDSPIWQLFSELCRALLKNSGASGEGEVWGALTDEVSWYFAKVTRTANGTTTLHLSNCLAIQKNRDGGNMECSHETKLCIEFLFTLVQGTAARTDAYADTGRMNRTLSRLQRQTNQAVQFTQESYSSVNPVAQEAAVEKEHAASQVSEELLLSHKALAVAFKEKYGEAATEEAFVDSYPGMRAESLKTAYASV